MKKPEKHTNDTWLSWSSGKDSAWTYHQLMQSQSHNVSGVFTTVNKTRNRVAMHSTRKALLLAQAKRLNIPLHIIEIPEPCTNDDYNSAMENFIQKAKSNHATHMAFGDLYLEDIRAYRETQLQNSGITPIFPLWHQPTSALAKTMITSGIKAKLTCVDTSVLSAEFVGRDFDQTLLNELPSHIDPCGENGEFHTFVYDGPMFDSPISILLGETHQADQFVYQDVDFAIKSEINLES